MLVLFAIVSCIVILMLMKIAKVFTKCMKLVNIVLTVFILFCYVSIFIGYNISYNTHDNAVMYEMLKMMSEDIVDYDISDMEDSSIQEYVRVTNNILNSSDIKSKVVVSDKDELNEFITKFDMADEASNWTRCYVRYTAWCLAEYSLDEESDDYWEMKYISSNKTASYNYGLMISYKVQGFLLTQLNAIAVFTLFITVYTLVCWILFNFGFVKESNNEEELK